MEKLLFLKSVERRADVAIVPGLHTLVVAAKQRIAARACNRQALQWGGGTHAIAFEARNTSGAVGFAIFEHLYKILRKRNDTTHHN